MGNSQRNRMVNKMAATKKLRLLKINNIPVSRSSEKRFFISISIPYEIMNGKME
jgi:hypothetical protein